MGRVKGQRWVIANEVLAVYDEGECPICATLEDVEEQASFHQGTLLKEVQAKHWSLLYCHHCNKRYMYYTEYTTQEDQE